MKQDFDPGYRQDAGAEFDHQKIIYAILERKWLVIGCLAGMLLLGALYILRTPKTYTAKTVLQVEQSERKVVKIEEINAMDLKQAEALKTIETNLVNSDVLVGLVKNLNLSAADLGLSPKSSAEPYTEGELAEALSKNVSAKLVRGTRLINVSADSTDASLAQKISNNVLTEYDRLSEEQRAGVSSDAQSSLRDEAARLKRQLELAEGEAQAFKDSHPDVALENSQEFIDQKILALNMKLNETKQMRFKLEADEVQAKRLLKGSNLKANMIQLMSIPSINTDPSVLQLQKSVSDSEAYLRQIGERYRAKHPLYIQAQAQLTSLQAALTQATVQSAQAISVTLESSQQTEKNFEIDLKKMEANKLAMDKLAIPYEGLKREVDASRQLYDQVNMRIKENTITSSLDPDVVRIVNQAALPLKPSKPNKPLILIACTILGLMMGLGTCFGLLMIDNSIKTVDQAELALGLPAVAAIPGVEKLEKGKRFLITQDPNGLVAEAFRTLRTSLSLEIGEAESRTILFTSSIPGEGKSFCAMNYAISLAQLGQRTLLIDGDLRLPMVGKSLFGTDEGNGIQSLLIGKSTLEESVKAHPEVPNLTILTSGTRRSNPAEVLSGPAFGELIKNAQGKYDRIVVDSAPVHAVSDTLLLIKSVSTVCFVIHAGRTPEKAVKRACHLLENAGARPAGIVLNRVSTQGGGYYYSYGGKYGDNVYGSTEKSA